ncbi:MAG: carbohydrate kinase [Pseudomonadota bacterium]
MILCCGEALIDMLPRKSETGEDAFAPYPGGAVFNTAIALGRLGAPAGFFCPLSSDFLGDLLAEALVKSHVDASACPRVARPCTVAFVQLVAGQAKYAFYDEGTALRRLTEAELPEVGDNVRALFCGGISLMSEPCGAAFEALMLREAGRRVTMIDPNIRPSFISDANAYRARIRRMMGAADIVKVSDEDLEWLMGPGPTDDLAQGLLAMGPALLCVTAGADGATGYTTSARVTRPAQKAEIVDTVGAGDTFNAGLLAALDGAGALSRAGLSALSDDNLSAALDTGARAAAITVSRAGANPPWAHEV